MEHYFRGSFATIALEQDELCKSMFNNYLSIKVYILVGTKRRCSVDDTAVYSIVYSIAFAPRPRKIIGQLLSA